MPSKPVLQGAHPEQSGDSCALDHELHTWSGTGCQEAWPVRKAASIEAVANELKTTLIPNSVVPGKCLLRLTSTKSGYSHDKAIYLFFHLVAGLKRCRCDERVRRR
jgi:hypothetical protein